VCQSLGLHRDGTGAPRGRVVRLQLREMALEGAHVAPLHGQQNGLFENVACSAA
jgi:hypothetical protein